MGHFYKIWTLYVTFLSLERCYAALGDVSKARFLRETLNAADAAAEVYGGDGLEAPEVVARLCILEKRFKAAESVYLEHNQLDEAIAVKSYIVLAITTQRMYVPNLFGNSFFNPDNPSLYFDFFQTDNTTFTTN